MPKQIKDTGGAIIKKRTNLEIGGSNKWGIFDGDILLAVVPSGRADIANRIVRAINSISVVAKTCQNPACKALYYDFPEVELGFCGRCKAAQVKK